MFFASCKKEEFIPEQILVPPQYLSWTTGDWWAYEWATYNYNIGDTTVHSADTTFALADTVINGETFRTLSQGIYPWNTGNMYMRDSTGYVIDNNGNIIFSYVNFTDTFQNHLVPGGGWFTQMVVDSLPTVVPAGSFNTINYRATNRYFTVACGDSVYYSNRQFAENIGMVRMSFHYSAQGPCADNVKCLVDYYIQ